MSGLIDSHCHLQNLQGDEREAALDVEVAVEGATVAALVLFYAFELSLLKAAARTSSPYFIFALLGLLTAGAGASTPWPGGSIREPARQGCLTRGPDQPARSGDEVRLPAALSAAFSAHCRPVPGRPRRARCRSLRGRDTPRPAFPHAGHLAEAATAGSLGHRGRGRGPAGRGVALSSALPAPRCDAFHDAHWVHALELRTAKGPVRQQTAIFTSKRHTLSNTLIDNACRDLN